LTDIARVDLNKDEQLAESYKRAGNVILAMQFQLGEPLGNPDEELPEFALKFDPPDPQDRVIRGSIFDANRRVVGQF
jgi:hypothetical protein